MERKGAKQQGNRATGQQGRQQGGRPRCHSGCFFAASDVLQDITRRILHYYCDRRCTMPSACCSAPSRCNVLPAALIFCFEMSSHNSAFLLCDVCLLLLRRSALCCERQNLAHISLSKSKLLVLALLQCPEREITVRISLSRREGDDFRGRSDGGLPKFRTSPSKEAVFDGDRSFRGTSPWSDGDIVHCSAPPLRDELSAALRLCCSMSADCSTSPLCDVPRTANCSGYFPLAERIAGLKELWYNNLRHRWHLPGQGCEAADTGDAGYYFYLTNVVFVT